ncbi:P-II family nitrogen regulator [Scytonema sp. PCC 10023]|uniref:P-II family nitrogen regulator n=1 Tax=Scytonema sp. PCC 10023 TaxID=1680591 RepID=UPI0039C6DC16
MSKSASPVEPAVLITIIGETVLKDRIVKLLKSHDVSGYTINQVQGEGGHGRRLGDMAAYNTNIEIKTIVSLEASDAILSALKDERGGHALIAYRHNVEAFF